MEQKEANILLFKLDEFIRKYYKNQLVKGAIFCLGLLLLFYLGISIVEHLGEFNSRVRTFLFYSFLVGSFAIIANYIFLPILKLYRFGKIISYEQAAKIIGTHFSSVQDKLINVLQLQNMQSSGGSTELLKAGIEQKISELTPVPFVAAIDIKENKKHYKIIAVPLFILVSILFFSPAVLQKSNIRLLKHDTEFEKELPFRFLITNKNLKAIQQEDFLLEIKIEGKTIPNEASIVLSGIEYPLEKRGKDSFSFLFRNIQKTQEFFIGAAGIISPQFELIALPRPTLLRLDAELEFPKYIGKPNEKISNSGDLIIPQGTKVRWKLSCRNTEQINFIFPDSTYSILPNNQSLFSISKRVMESSVYKISAGNKFVKSADSTAYSISVIADAYPTIDVVQKTDSLKTSSFYFSGKIKDDYGFSALKMEYKILSTDSSGKAKEKVGEMKIPFNGKINSQQFIHYFDMNNIGLSPGDRLEYFFEVWDNDGVNGAKKARSATLNYKSPSIEELNELVEKNNSELKEDLEQSIKKAKEVQKEINQLNKTVLEKKQLGWEEKKKLEGLLEKQKSLQKKIEQIQQENKLNTNQKNEFQQPDENVLEKQKQLEELFENIMTPEMKKLFEELQKLMEKLDKNKVQETLEKMKLNSKDIEKELDRTLEQFKHMEAEQKMENLTKKLDELNKKQEELAKQTENKSETQETLEKKQESLNKEFQQFKDDAHALEKLNEKLEEPLPIPDTKQEEQNIDKEMQNASEQLQNKNNKNAGKSQKNAAKQMQSLSEKMQGALEQMQEEQNSEDMQALRQILENLMTVSFAQEDLIKETQKTKTTNPQFVQIGQKQKKLQDDSKMIEDSLMALSKRNPTISAMVNREINAIQMNMEKAIGAIEERISPEASVREQNAMTSINNLALMLNESLENMQMQAQQQMKSKSQGSGTCKKPGGKGQKPSSSNMRQMQESLNKQIEQMKKMLEQGKQQGGKKPGQKEGQGGLIPGNSEQLAKMAAEQEAIRRAIQEAMQKAKKNGGNLPGGDLAEKMEQTETELVNKTITQETIRRQQEILSKLLEHEKAEREREMEEKRKSNEAKEVINSNPNLFLEYKRMKEQEMELLKTVPPSMNPYYKTKVNQYFNSFDN